MQIRIDGAALKVSDYAWSWLPTRCPDIILVVLTITRIGALKGARRHVFNDRKDTGRTTTIERNGDQQACKHTNKRRFAYL